jgi:uncharacterized protein YndB with AHSA1/START domain
VTEWAGRPAPVGHTQDAGWQIGVSKTLDAPIEQVWDFLTSPEGMALWLGHGVTVLEEPGQPYQTQGGTHGEVRSVHSRDRIRLTWRPPGWDHDSTVQVAVRPAGPGRTMLRFHQERLTSALEREQQRTHWRTVLASVTTALQPR